MRDIGFDIQASAIPKDTFVVYGDTRCISGDAFIGYQVRTPGNELQNDKGGSLARLFHRFHRIKSPGSGSYQRKQTVDSIFTVPSMSEDGRLFHSRIVDVIDSGFRECVRVRTVGGLELICTPDHPIADESPTGFTAADQLKTGSQILVHRHVPWTAQEAERPRVNRPELYVKHHPTAPSKVVRCSSGEYHYKRLTRARAVYEAYWNDLTLDAYVARLNDGQLDGLKFLTSDIHVHHKDENKLNDVPSNLVALSCAEHSRAHFVLPNGRPRSGSYIAVVDIISSITPAGQHQTYDVKVIGPDHNFVADGFIVHNSGKTRFGATFPRPLVIVDVGERGYETIQNMDRSLWWEPDVMPIIKGIDKMSDIAELAGFVQPLIASGRICSVVFDAFTFYCDFYLSQLNTMMPGADTRQIYGKLGTHLQFVRNTLHQLPVNVVWNCLAAAPETSEAGTTKMGGPLIPGSQGPKYAAGVNYLLHSRLTQKKDKGLVVEESYELRTKQYGLYAAGHRQGFGVLPDPFVMGSYADLAPWLGYDVDAIRRSMKPIAAGNGKPAITRPAVAPVVVNRSAPKAISPTGK